MSQSPVASEFRRHPELFRMRLQLKVPAAPGEAAQRQGALLSGLEQVGQVPIKELIQQQKKTNDERRCSAAISGPAPRRLEIPVVVK